MAENSQPESSSQGEESGGVDLSAAAGQTNESSSCASDRPSAPYTLDEYYMAIALTSCMRSRDPEWQVGACIVNEKNRVVSTGYNGMPNRCKDDDHREIFPFTKDKDKDIDKEKGWYVCHAELNAILSASCADLNGCRVYVTRFPCNECAKLIIQSDIKEVIYLAEKEYERPEGCDHERPDIAVSKRMLKQADVTFSQSSLTDPESNTRKNQLLITFSGSKAPEPELKMVEVKSDSD